MNVSDKIAIITGSGRGLGKAIALKLAEFGANIVVCDIDIDGANAVAEEIKTLGNDAIAIKLDVTNKESINNLLKISMSKFKKVYILVNNAGVLAAPGWETRDRPDEVDWDFIYSVNVKGVAFTSEIISSEMKQNRSGSIVNISSVAGRLATLTSIPYGVSKAGIINLTQAHALELAPYNINVNAVCPGMIWTDMWNRIATQWLHTPNKISQGANDQQEVFKKAIQARTPLGREHTPEDIANAVTFLASDAAINITGQALNVNGGSHIH